VVIERGMKVRATHNHRQAQPGLCAISSSSARAKRTVVLSCSSTPLVSGRSRDRVPSRVGAGARHRSGRRDPDASHAAPLALPSPRQRPAHGAEHLPARRIARLHFLRGAPGRPPGAPGARGGHPARVCQGDSGGRHAAPVSLKWVTSRGAMVWQSIGACLTLSLSLAVLCVCYTASSPATRDRSSSSFTSSSPGTSASSSRMVRATQKWRGRENTQAV